MTLVIVAVRQEWLRVFLPKSKMSNDKWRKNTHMGLRGWVPPILRPIAENICAECQFEECLYTEKNNLQKTLFAEFLSFPRWYRRGYIDSPTAVNRDPSVGVKGPLCTQGLGDSQVVLIRLVQVRSG
jgi:hypothetical protein